MVSKIKITPTKPPKIHRRRPRKPSPSTPIAASIHRSLRTCRRRLLGLFSLLSPTNIKYHRQRSFHRLTPLPPSPTPLPPTTLPPRPHPTKPTLFLDLDETLVHSKPQSPPDNTAYDFIVYPKIDQKLVPFYLSKHPGVDAFLKKVAEQFEVVVFTAGVSEYASLVVDGLDPEGMLVSHRLYRGDCREVEGRLVKDLSGRGRDLGRALIVDDKPNCYSLQPENAVPVKAYLGGGGEDGELERVLGFFDRALVFEDEGCCQVLSVGRGSQENVMVFQEILKLYFVNLNHFSF